ncbi:MAG: PTS sugar transporter subunit IIA [Sedimentisphaeraceae bacterium JB056]
MLLTQIMKKSSVVVPLKSTDKEDVITELVDVLDSNSLLKDRDMVLDSVLMREQTRSTGIGSGIAIPHGKSRGVDELAMAIGIAKNPIDFDSIDNKGVTIVVLLVSPSGQTGPHIQALAKISRLMLDEAFRTQLQEASDADELYELIRSKESE